MNGKLPTFSLSQKNLTVADLKQVSHIHTQIYLEQESWDAIRESRKRLLNTLETGEVSVQGINTDFGYFNKTGLDLKANLDFQISTLKCNIVSYGGPVTEEIARAIMAMKIHELAKGFSGVSEETIKHIIYLFNWPVIPYIPTQGDFGGSDHSNSLSYFIYAFTGYGKVQGEKGTYVSAKEYFARHGLTPLVLQSYELPQLISGNQAVKALGMNLLTRAENISKIADDVFSLSFEALNGNHTAFFEKIHEARNQLGQLETCHDICSKIRENGHPSEMNQECKKIKSTVQDAYTLRCCCQVHGVFKDALKFCKSIYEKELNTVSHSPFVTKSGKVISNGNFTAVYNSKNYDYLMISVHEIGSFSERRTQRLTSPILNQLSNPSTHPGKGDPLYLVLHRMSSALTAESKTVCHPSSVDTIPTSANKEDFNSNGVNGAFKLDKILDRVERILAIELIVASQSIELLRPWKTTSYLETFYENFRKKVNSLNSDSDIGDEIEAGVEFLRDYYK